MYLLLFVTIYVHVCLCVPFLFHFQTFGFSVFVKNGILITNAMQSLFPIYFDSCEYKNIYFVNCFKIASGSMLFTMQEPTSFVNVCEFALLQFLICVYIDSSAWYVC